MTQLAYNELKTAKTNAGTNPTPLPVSFTYTSIFQLVFGAVCLGFAIWGMVIYNFLPYFYGMALPAGVFGVISGVLGIVIFTGQNSPILVKTALAFSVAAAACGLGSDVWQIVLTYPYVVLAVILISGTGLMILSCFSIATLIGQLSTRRDYEGCQKCSCACPKA